MLLHFVVYCMCMKFDIVADHNKITALTDTFISFKFELISIHKNFVLICTY
jgi:predicted membrane chloride channel (bestrophin family)